MNFTSRRRFALLSVFMLAPLGAHAQASYHIVDRWPVDGSGGWDYMLADAPAHKLYIAHNARVEVIDTETGKPTDAITGLKSTHGIALDPNGKTGYISDGAGNAIVVFDRATFQVLATIPVGTNPDGIVYEPATRTVWAFNGRSHNVSVLDTVSRTIIATIALPGKPEFPAVDNDGNVFVNIEDKNEILKFSASQKTILATWTLHSCDSPSGLAIDREGHRLFSVCDGGHMAIVDTRNGSQLATASIGDGPDATAYDATRKLAFSSNGGDGTLSVIDAAHGSYGTLQTLPTQHGARTLALDTATGRIYLATAHFAPPPAPTVAVPHPRPTAVPGSFTILVVAP